MNEINTSSLKDVMCNSYKCVCIDICWICDDKLYVELQ